MSQKYFYKVTRRSSQSICSDIENVCINYKIGEIFTATIPNSLLIGFETKRQSIDYINSLTWFERTDRRVFRCLPMNPIHNVYQMSNDFTYNGFVDFWQCNKHTISCKYYDLIKAPRGTVGCAKIKILAELKLDTLIIG